VPPLVGPAGWRAASIIAATKLAGARAQAGEGVAQIARLTATGSDTAQRARFLLTYFGV
jgi:hypothetical protein